jgi:hypothetical protein
MWREGRGKGDMRAHRRHVWRDEVGEEEAGTRWVVVGEALRIKESLRERTRARRRVVTSPSLSSL